MESTHLLVRPAPTYEHPGEWFGAQRVGEGPAGSSTSRTPPAQPSAPHDGPADPSRVHEAAARDAHAFVVSAMTQVLEVLDRRRPIGKLSDVVVPHVVDQVTSLQRATEVAAAVGGCAPQPPTAALRRVHLQMCAHDEAEFFGSYLRGERVLAFAGRAELVSVRVRAKPGRPTYARSKQFEHRWRIRSLALG